MRGGRSESKRRALFSALLRAEDAESAYPTNGNCVPSDVARANVKPYTVTRDSLQRTYKQAVRERHGLFEEEAQSIIMEGLEENWPMPAVAGLAECP